ncbi:MAG: tyrosine-type recombinase/integrase [Alphaproteobacteria bacterium]
MSNKILKKTIDALKPKEKEYTIWDNELKGFGCKITPKGKKVFLLQYRFEGRVRKYTIGTYGSPWTPEQAREEAKSILGDVAKGTDPATIKSKMKQSITVEELCIIYLETACKHKKESTLVSDRGRIKGHIIPLLGKKKAKDVTKRDIEKFIHDVAAGITAQDSKTGFKGRSIIRGGQGVATRTIGLLGAIFNFAIDTSIRTDNPVHGVKKYPYKKLTRYLSQKELVQLGEVLKSEEEKGVMHPSAIHAIRLLILTGARKSEILKARWEYVDFDNGFLRLPDSKTGAKSIPLGLSAVEYLQKMENNPSGWIISGDKEGHHLVNLQKPWDKIRKKSGLEDVRIHDLRHSFASIGASGGDSLLMIGAVLGHKKSSTTERYAHLSNSPVKQTADNISCKVAALLDGGK